jgi:uncharacterized protein (DUF433 family)
MQLEDYFDFFEHPYSIRLKGHRIGLEHIVKRFNDGYSAEMIVHELPNLRLEQAYAAITYYLHNKAQVDEYMAELDRFVEEQVAPPGGDPGPLARPHARSAGTGAPGGAYPLKVRFLLDRTEWLPY